MSLLPIPSCRQSSSGQGANEDKKRKEYIVDYDLDQIKERGYLTAIMENSSTGLFIYKGNTMGYEYELLKLFCEDQNLELRVNITQNLKEAFNKLNTGEGDILAFNLTVTKEREKQIKFTQYHNLQRQVLVQRKPENWNKLNKKEIDAKLIRNPVELIGKKVVVRPHSSYYDRLVNLSEEIGGDIKIISGDRNVETEQLIRMVAQGKIDYTIAEENLALVNATYYPNLDVETTVSFPTQIAWGVRKNSEQLLEALNGWIDSMKKNTDYYVIYDKYFRSSKFALRRSKSKYSSLNVTTDHISPYDSLIREAARELNWDWYLLAALIYRESKFEPTVKSPVGATGLMQIMPRTGSDYGINDLHDPAENIYAGTQHLLRLQNYWLNKGLHGDDQIKFILASYNVGLGHLQDAVRLAEKYGADPKNWDDVSSYLYKKSFREYFTDPVVEYGYCRGSETVEYVKDVLDLYRIYRGIFVSGKNNAENPL